MKFYNIQNIEEFMKAIDKCKGSVYLVTPEGDKLNLKSKLSQYVSLSKIMQSKNEISGLEVQASDPDDVQTLLEFMIDGI